MRALHKRLGFFTGVAIVTSAPTYGAEGAANVVDVANSAALCMLSAAKDGADQTRFSGEGWVATDAAGGRYQHETSPITIEFPADDDGIRRICTVRATLASLDQQEVLVETLESMLRFEPIKQSDSMIWMISLNGHRGIQLYKSENAEQPEVRLIGAAF